MTPMNPSAASPSMSPSASPATRPARRRVVDAPTRMFHWLFALSFAGAYVTGDSEHWRALHVTLGYVLGGLLVFRVLYGLVGPRHARLGLWGRKLAALPDWLRSLTAAWREGVTTINWRQGQNLAAALAVVALLAGALPLVLSGYATHAEWGGDRIVEALEEVHEFLGNAMLMAVAAHLTLLLALSLMRRKNQALPMLTGHIEGAGPDLVRRNAGWLAALLLIAVIGFGAWQWQSSPQGLWPTGSADAQALEHHAADEDDDD